MPATTRGDLRGDGLRVAVLVARWNAGITDRLRDGALAVLVRAGVRDADIAVVEVPGAFELPQAALAVAKTGRFDAVVALGCVLKGETPHDEHIARACAEGLQHAALTTGVPTTFGVITGATEAQAKARSDLATGAGGKGGHKGMEAAEAAVRLADALRQLSKGPGGQRLAP